MFRTCIFLLVIILIASNVYARSSAFKNPPDIEINYEAMLDEEFLQRLNSLIIHFDKSKNQLAVNVIRELKATINRDKAKELIEELKKHVTAESYKEIKQLELIVEFGSKHDDFLFVNDKQGRKYKFVNTKTNDVIEIPKPPQIEVSLDAKYVCSTDNSECNYSYEILNSEQSEGAVNEINIESKFNKELLQEEYRRRNINRNHTFDLTSTIQQRIFGANGFEDYFTLWAFKKSNSQVEYIAPGVKQDKPYTLYSIQNSEPGLVSCYIPVADYEIGNFISFNDGPEFVANVMTSSVGKTGYMYRGITLGPVPTLESVEWELVIGRLMQYIELAKKFDWLDDSSDNYLKTHLNKIESSKSDKNVKFLLGELKNGQILSSIPEEMNFLIRYYLEKLI